MLELSVESLQAGYGAVSVLHGVSLQVREGETVVLLGTNGNGKSTLMKCIMGLLKPSHGSIILESEHGRIVAEAAPAAIILDPIVRRIYLGA